ncbi:MAG: MarR family transcriptional regulator [Solobacterium sp.]|nr:MarR family transcriptional regulator [Solobacterium sp.]MBR3359185.1 MarR family transcriptional regulator [Solobacterium sp.]MBR6157117.1 MarR family transcriptional regulator [Lachnospiraceae bacterium]
MNEKYKTITSENNTLISNIIHTIDKNLLKIYNRELSRYGLTMQQSLVILYIGNSDKEKVFQIDIEKYLGLKNPSVTSLIKNLMANDYVYRIKDETDGRYFHLHLTEKSLAIKDDLAKAIYNINQDFENRLTKDEHAALVTLLQKVSSIIQQELDAPAS